MSAELDGLRARFVEMGGEGSVTLSLDGPIAELKLARPEARNALSAKMLVELDDAVTALAGWEGAAVVIHGGVSFCSGADLGQVRGEMSEGDAGAHLNAFGTALMDRLRALPQISVAAVSGFATGGGAELALACDFRVMALDATIHFAHASLGVTPGWGSAGRLTGMLGRRAALSVLLRARPIGAQRALHLGLADRVSPPGEAVEHASALLRETVLCEPGVARQVKAVVSAADTLPAAEARAIEQEAFRTLWGGPAQARALKRLNKGRKKRR